MSEYATPVALSPSRSFFFNDTATTEIYTLSLHDALPIYCDILVFLDGDGSDCPELIPSLVEPIAAGEYDFRSEEHTSELQSHSDLVCRLLLEKKKNTRIQPTLASKPSVPPCSVGANPYRL